MISAIRAFRPALRTLPVASAALIGAALAIAACGGRYKMPHAHTWTVERELDELEGVQKLIVHAHTGRVQIEGGEQLAGAAVLEIRGDSPEQARARASTVRVELTRGAEELRVHATPPANAPLESLDCSYRFTVPANVAVEVFSETAVVILREFAGSARVRTRSGQILANLSGGECDLRSTDGAIRLAGGFHHASLHSKRGGIFIALPEPDGKPIRVEASDDDGQVTVEIAHNCRFRVGFRTERGDVRTELTTRWDAAGTLNGDRQRVWSGIVGPDDRPIAGELRCASRGGGLLVRRRGVPASAGR